MMKIIGFAFLGDGFVSNLILRDGLNLIQLLIDDSFQCLS